VHLRNTSESSFTIQQVHVTSGPFIVSAAQQLPQELPASASALIRVAITREAEPLEKKVEGVVTVVTSQGCATVRIGGAATAEWPAYNHSIQAIDFGEVVVGAESAPRQLRIQLMGAGAGEERLIGFVTDAGEFSILPPQPARETLMESCDTMNISLSFKAPPTPGRISGSLMWERASPEASAIIMLPLSGSAVAR
jgi:hypothetical protein